MRIDDRTTILDAIFDPRSSIVFVVDSRVTDSPEFRKIMERLEKVQKDLEADKKKRLMLRRMAECYEAKANPV